MKSKAFIILVLGFLMQLGHLSPTYAQSKTSTDYPSLILALYFQYQSQKDELPPCLQGLPRSELEEVLLRIEIYTQSLENLRTLKEAIFQKQTAQEILQALADKLAIAWEQSPNEEKTWKALKEKDWQKVEALLCPYLVPPPKGTYETEGRLYESPRPLNEEEKIVYFTPSGNVIHLPSRAIPYFGSKFSEVHPLALVKFQLDGDWYLAKYNWENHYFLGYNYRYNVLGVSIETIYEEPIDFWEEFFPQPKESVQIMASVPSISFIAPEISPPATTATAGRLLSMRLLNLSLVGALTGLQGDTRQKGNTGEGPIPSKEEFDKLLFKAAYELGMPDPKTDPEEALDWLLKKQKERRLTIQEQALLEKLVKKIYKNQIYLNKYENVELDEDIGRGRHKITYPVKKEPNVVIAKLRPEKVSNGYAFLIKQIRDLEKLKQVGIPTVPILGITIHEGVLGLVLKRYSGLIQPFSNINENLKKLFNQNTLKDLRKIRSVISKQNIYIDDIQFLISSDGRIVVFDPDDVSINADEKDIVLEAIDDIISDIENYLR